MDTFVQAPLILPKMQDKMSLKLGWRTVDALMTLWWGSVDAQFQDVVWCMSIRALHKKVANTPKMNRDIPMSILYN